MTSMPASRSERAITLAPRSWPSRPALAMTTRMGRSIRGSVSTSDLRDVAVLEVAPAERTQAGVTLRARGRMQGSVPAVGRQARAQRDLILAAVENYDWEAMRAFVESLDE